MDNPPGSLLLVEDEAIYSDMLGGHLRDHGFHVTLAESGGQAIRMLKDGTFDLVLLDILLPGISGIDVLKYLRETHSATELPVIMATVMDQSSDIVDALKLGANDYVTKPFDLPVVLARVQTHLTVKRSVDRIIRLERHLEERNAELEVANRELAQMNKRMKRDLEAAARVQQALLPSTPLDVPGARFAWSFRPCTELAGDLLNVLQIDTNNIALYVLDVVGHGVAAALMAVTVNRVLTYAQSVPATLGEPRRGAEKESRCSPAEVAERLAREFPWDPRTEQFFTIVHGVLSLDTSEFRFVSAGHPGPVYLPHQGEPAVLDVAGSPIGLGGEHYEEHSMTMRTGDRIYMYSDGVLDAMNAEGRRFGQGRLIQALSQSRNGTLADSLNCVLQQLDKWSNRTTPHDDISLVAVEFVGEGAS